MAPCGSKTDINILLSFTPLLFKWVYSLCGPICELSLMCQICQIFSTMLKEAFVEEERLAASSSSLETVAGLSDSALLCVRLVSRVHCGDWTDWSHHQNPAVLPALYACQPSPFPWEGFHCQPPHPPTPFQTRCLECYTDQGKIINCPFVLAAISTGENKLMVMKPYRVRFRRRLWCDLPSSGVEPSSRGPPAASWGLQPADGAPAHSNAQVLLLFPLFPNPTQLLPTSPAD